MGSSLGVASTSLPPARLCSRDLRRRSLEHKGLGSFGFAMCAYQICIQFSLRSISYKS